MGDYVKTGIVMLKRSQLHPHPDNPRKDLGDLEELKASIREHGIMQNLTMELHQEHESAQGTPAALFNAVFLWLQAE